MGTVKLSVHKREQEITQISILPEHREWGSGYWVQAWDLCELASDLVSLAIDMKGEEVVARALKAHAATVADTMRQRAENAAATARLMEEACVK